MKKGIINIILLVLVLTNVILSAIIVFAVVPALNSANDLVGKVAEAIDLEKECNDQYSDTISIDSVVVYNFEEKVTVALKGNSDNDVHYAQFGVTLSLNKDDESYEKYKDKLSANENLMKSTITNVMRQYTTTEIQNNQEAILEEITMELRELYNNTTFIYETAFVNIVFQ